MSATRGVALGYEKDPTPRLPESEGLIGCPAVSSHMASIRAFVSMNPDSDRELFSLHHSLSLPPLHFVRSDVISTLRSQASPPHSFYHSFFSVQDGA